MPGQDQSARRQEPPTYGLEYMESVIKAKGLRECFTVDLPEEKRKFGLKLLLRALYLHKFGALVAYRLSQRNYWLVLRSEKRAKPWKLLGRLHRVFRKYVLVIFYERLQYIVFRTEISVFAELGPGVLATFDQLGITAGSRVMTSASLHGRVNLVNHRGYCPTICEDAIILTGCVIIGGVTVGKGATVGANSVVLSDVPPGATVIGNPAKVVFQRPVE